MPWLDRDDETAPPSRSLSFFVRMGTILAVVLAIHWWAWTGTEMSLSRIAAGFPAGFEFLGQLFPPDQDVTQTVAGAALETLQMAIIGTTLGAIIALPFGFLAADNVSPRAVYHLTRTVLGAIRSVPLLLYALVFVVAVGLGPLAGTLAIVVYTVGMLGKFYAEAVEAIDSRPVEGVMATGAGQLTVLRHAVFPQVLPQFVGYTLYRLEVNFREATILGLVGAGGIGFYITLYMRSFSYGRVATVALVILIMVLLIDALSAYLRSKVI